MVASLVLYCSKSGIAGLKTAHGVDHVPILCLVLSRVGRGLAIGRSSVKGVLSECLRTHVSKINSEFKYARRPNSF